MVVENIYRESDEAKHNVQVWTNARTIQDARPHLKKVSLIRFLIPGVAALPRDCVGGGKAGQ
jgi:hypothetical protein